MYIDTHCHIDDDKIENKELTVKNYSDNGVNIVINMGSNLKSSLSSKALSEKYDSVYFACGIHPDSVSEYDEKAVDILSGLLYHDKCVGVGEIGLDYHYEPYDKNKQIEVFNSQIDIAYKSGLPFTVHSRDATLDTLNVLKENKEKLSYGFVMHCFSGSIETAKEYLNLGGYISFGGTVTFKNSKTLREVAKFVPNDRLLTETDSPYLAPEPVRGSINEPKNIPYVLKFLAELRGENDEVLAMQIMENAKRIFKKIK